jgi:hypothetical protein
MSQDKTKKLVSLKVYEHDLIEFQQLAERLSHLYKKELPLTTLFSGAIFTLQTLYFNNEVSFKTLKQ